MKLFLLEWLGYTPRWHVMDMIVVVAPNEGEARLTASAKALDEGASAWLDPARSTCEEIAMNAARVVFVDARY